MRFQDDSIDDYVKLIKDEAAGLRHHNDIPQLRFCVELFCDIA